MISPLQSLVTGLLRLLPLNESRPCEETLADWRREALDARGLRRPVVALRALGSVARCVFMISAREARSRESMELLFRVVIVSLVSAMIFIGVRWNESIVVDGARVPLGPVAAALLSVGTFLGAMPFIAFLTAALGRRRAAAPRLGPALVLGVVMFVTMGWVMPVTNQAYREFVFGLQATGPLPRGINELSLVELVEMLFTPNAGSAAFGLNLRLFFVIASPVMLVLGITARSLSGWRRFTSSVLPLVLFCLPLAPLLEWPETFLLAWPALLAAALVTRALARTTTTTTTKQEI